MVDKKNAFGKELRRLRKEAKYKQSDLAKSARISASYISQLENGKRNPTDRVITQLSGALDIPENRLLIKIGKLKMDLAATLATDRKQVNSIISSLSDEQWQEILTYLAYVKVKSSLSSP
jgi:transcriptional regulator with XRE-family HTH domain